VVSPLLGSIRHGRGDSVHRLLAIGMTSRTFNIPGSNRSSTVTKTRDGTDVAARYFVYKLYEATGGQPMQWQVLLGMGESAATISRAVERGWVILQEVSRKPLERNAALTGDGRRLARKGRQSR
jgi:hypothetical protein